MTLSMKANIKERWVTALESGEYRQGAGILHERGGWDGHDSFCCLGVLCKMAVDDGLDIINPEQNGSVVEYDGESAYLPRSVADWAGFQYTGERTYEDAEIEEQRGILETTRDGRGETVSLAVMNDSAVPFDEIAQTIREKVVGV